MCYFLILIFSISFLASCASQGPSAKRHSFSTVSGKRKLQHYNDLYNGKDKQFDYRIKKTKKANKKAGYKPKKR